MKTITKSLNLLFLNLGNEDDGFIERRSLVCLVHLSLGTDDYHHDESYAHDALWESVTVQ